VSTRHSLSPQPWPWAGPRVLVEHADGERADALLDAFRRAGYAVAVCAGPLPDERCPLTCDEGCAAADGADLIVSSLGLQTSETRDVLASLRRRLPRTPLLVEAPTDDVAQWAEFVDGCKLVDAPAGPDELVATVRAALEREDSA
jgi:DNA-binding response OmpR family regulator